MTTPICPECGSVAVIRDHKTWKRVHLRCTRCGYTARTRKFTEHEPDDRPFDVRKAGCVLPSRTIPLSDEV